MKQILILALATLILTGVSQAQDVKPKGAEGDKALLFSLNGLSNLGAGDFNGGFGMRYHFASNLSVRFGLGFSTSSTTTKRPVAMTTGADEKDSEFELSVAPGIEYWLMKNGPVAAYVGAQIAYLMSSETNENMNFVANTKLETTRSGIGGGVIMGVQWFPWSNVGLGAEYQLGFSSISGKVKSTNSTGTTTESDSPSTTSIMLGSMNGAAFTLEIYM